MSKHSTTSATVMLVAWLVAAPEVSHAASDNTAPAMCTLASLPGMSAQLSRAVRASGRSRAVAQLSASSLPNGPASAAFLRVARGIVGGTVNGPTFTDLPCGDAVRARDQLVWSLGLAGYAPGDIADVLEGTTTVRDLDEARYRLMSGEPRRLVAAFLDARRHELLSPPPIAIAALPPASPAVPRPATDSRGDDFETQLTALARAHRVSPDLVRAVVATESNWNVRAVSPAGAIGLMQLMPATARSLGVDPWHPADNLRGGITYLGSLLRAYREDARLALIAYHAGPTHANRVRDGRAVAYSSTQRYLHAIDARYRLPQ